MTIDMDIYITMFIVYFLCAISVASIVIVLIDHYLEIKRKEIKKNNQKDL